MLGREYRIRWVWGPVLMAVVGARKRSCISIVFDPEYLLEGCSYLCWCGVMGPRVPEGRSFRGPGRVGVPGEEVGYSFGKRLGGVLLQDLRVVSLHVVVGHLHWHSFTLD